MKFSFLTLLYSNVLVVCVWRVENYVECVQNFTPPSFVCLKLTSVMTLLTVYVLLAMLWQPDEIGLNMAVVCSLYHTRSYCSRRSNTTVFSIVEKAELVAIRGQSFKIVCCYRQPSSVDVTLLYNLDHLLDKHPLLSSFICGDFNVHESTSNHTSSAGTATPGFCESRGLHQLVNFPTRLNVILDLVMTEYPGSVQALSNFNTSDHVAILLTLSSLTHVIFPPDRLVYHWSHTPWG